jgi:NADPH:quinone reductase-like Zn-dependent oxidoreductase
MGMLLAHPDNNDLTIIKEFIESGKVKPVIDRQYSLKDTTEAMKYLEEGHAKGKIIITMEHDK